MPRKNSDDDPKFRLRPGKPPIPRERRSSPALSVAFRAVLKYARSSRAGRRQQAARARPAHLQHCAVRVSYSSNRVAGHWRAHGRYIERESASHDAEKSGFGAAAVGVDIASKLRDWQEGADPRLWKLILSPEFGERLDLQRLTRDVMSRMESDLHTSLDWVAVSHFNTEHPHVHVALRGLDTRGAEFKLDREYVKSGLRSVAQHFTPTLSKAAAWLSNRAGRHSRASPASPAPAFHTTRPVDCGANSAVGRRFRRAAGPGRPHTSGPRAVRGSPRAIAGGPVDDSRNDGSRPSGWTAPMAGSARSGDGFEGHAASGGSSENARRPRRASV